MLNISNLDAGDKIKFLGEVSDEQVEWGSHKDPRGLLEKDGIYTIKKVEIHSWHTDIFIEEMDGSFNSVWFDLVDDMLEGWSDAHKRDALFSRALSTYGLEAQIGVLQEECAELIVACSKYYRSGGTNQKELIEEIADVKIMLEQMEFTFGKESIDKKVREKLERFKNRLFNSAEKGVREV